MTDEAKLDKFFRRIASWERLGKRVSPRGLTFYALPRDEHGVETGHLWLQRLFPALTEAEFGKMERAFGVALPEAFRQFYLRANGANLFGNSLALYGWIDERMSDLAVGLGLYNKGLVAPVIGDKAYLGHPSITTPKRKNMAHTGAWPGPLNRLRKRIETSFSVLVGSLTLHAAQVKTFWSLRARVNLKIAAHNLVHAGLLNS